MGWFDEQIRQRKEHDDDMFAEAFIHIAGAVIGAKLSASLNDDRQITKNAIDEILKFYHVKSREVPGEIREMNEQLEYLMRPYGIMRRSVRLEPGWYRDAIGPMLGVYKDGGSIVALLPSGISGYVFTDRESGEKVRVNRENQGLFEAEAMGFYQPFPLKKMGMRDLVTYILHTLSTADFVMFGLASLAVIGLGLFTPALNRIIFSDLIDSGSRKLWLAMMVLLVSISISAMLFDSVKRLLLARINIKMDVSVEAAVMMRILSLPADFFKQYSSGELFSRAQHIGALCDLLVSTVLSTALTSVFSLAYVAQIFVYAPSLAVPAILMLLASLVVSTAAALVQTGISRRQLELSAKESGMSYALISGVQKIRLSGAEKRAFARWGNLYAREAELTYNPPMFIKVNLVISTAITLVGTVIMYGLAVKNQISVSEYYAFSSAYGMVTAAFTALAGVALTIAQLGPIMNMAKPILEAVPEISEGKQVVTRLSGAIELNNVSFRYQDNMPDVIDDLSLKIRAGQYVAIVGSTGCGKSTLMRLMLGFEMPRKGAVYYDGRDVSRLDLKSLRKKIGVVMQNGKLFLGDIFSNITISAPQLTLDDAWEAAELAGIAEDIRQMPMGMFTMVTEGGGGVSGGQRQRLLIARAIAPKPKILMFDEATSALDNLTQKRVSEALDGLKCTRIVIAHRLSTIRQCDRIIVLDKGKIVEDGTYEELIEQNGFFAELVARQRVDQG